MKLSLCIPTFSPLTFASTLSTSIPCLDYLEGPFFGFHSVSPLTLRLDGDNEPPPLLSSPTFFLACAKVSLRFQLLVASKVDGILGVLPAI